ncbi:MAG TPA: NosD domain-containing protein, partial [Gemmatimonadales bacterium]|nr:NosD domain-containing protein [Gemmatimonadales bacterium]
VQFGTAAFPFDHPLRAFAAVHDGDTIAVAPGTYDFVDYGVLNVGVVIQGGTPGDTTTRPLFRDAQAGYHTALQLDGGQRTVVQNVAFRNFSFAVDLEGVRTFALEDGKVELTGGTYGSGIYTCANTLDTVRVDRSVFLGDSTGDALINDYCVQRTALLLVRDTKLSGWLDGITWPDADSLVMLRSDVSDNSGYGVYATQEYQINPSLYIAHSRIARNGNTQVYGYPLRRATIDSSRIDAPATRAVDVEGACSECGPQEQVAFHGDTITIGPAASFQNWLQTFNADTFVMDRTVVQFPDTVSIYTNSDIEANSATITRSQFQNLGSGQAFRFTGLRIFGDSVTMTGCAVAGCDQAYGFYPNSGEGGPQLQALTVMRSHFTQVGTALYGSVNGTATITGNVIDSASYAVQVYADSVTATDNVLTRISAQGFQLQAFSGTGVQAVIARDSVTCTGATARGIDVTGFPFVLEDNYLSGCYLGVYEQRALPGSVVRRNTVRGAVDGITVNQLDTVTVRVDSNGVSGASDAAVARVNGGRVAMTHNNISGNVYGVYLSLPSYGGPVRDDLHDNSFTGNSSYAVYSAYDTVNAQQNWWGLSTGSHSGPGSDSAFGYVDTTNFLSGPPVNLPGLAPRFLATARPVRIAPQLAAPLTAPRAAPPALPPRQRRAFVVGPRMPAATIARVQEQIRRQAEHDARDAARRSTRP